MTASSTSTIEQQDTRAEGFLEAVFRSEGASIFGPIEQEVGLEVGAVAMKGLQLLFWLRSQHPLTRPDMVRSLEQWRGTGRNEVGRFEPAHSAPALLDRMVKAELLWEMGVPTKRVLVSPKGIALLLRLHPACEDLDLPWRLARWASDWPGAENDIERYVRVFVSRQKGFAPPTEKYLP